MGILCQIPVLNVDVVCAWESVQQNNANDNPIELFIFITEKNNGSVNVLQVFKRKPDNGIVLTNNLLSALHSKKCLFCHFVAYL